MVSLILVGVGVCDVCGGELLCVVLCDDWFVIEFDLVMCSWLVVCCGGGMCVLICFDVSEMFE